MLTVHHLSASQSDRIVWLCEELGVPYSLKRYDRDPETRMAPAEYRALHPSGTAPVISDGPLVLAETGAIIEYIIAKHGGGRLKLACSDPEFANYLFWFHFANASFMPRVMMMKEMVASPWGGPQAASMLRDRSAAAYALVERRLGEAAYFAGDQLTAADIMMVFPLTTMRLFVPRDISGFPNILAYLGRIGERPAFQSAMRKADPDLPLHLS